MQATTWNRKALLSAFDKPPPLFPLAVLVFDLALFGAGSALVLLAASLALKLVGTLDRHRRHRAAVPDRPRRLPRQLLRQRAAERRLRPDRLPAVDDRLQPLGSRPQHGAPRLQQPEGPRPGLGAASRRPSSTHCRGIARRSSACIAAASAGARTTWSRCGGRSSSSPAAGRSARAAASTSSTACSSPQARCCGSASSRRGTRDRAVLRAAGHAGRRRAVPAVERHHGFRRLPAPHEPDDRLVPEPAGMAAQQGLPDVHRLRALSVRHRSPDARHHGAQRAPPEPADPDVHAARRAAGAAARSSRISATTAWTGGRTWTACGSCKLYDYANHAWLDFGGQVTARVPMPIAAT